ncbi:hypothetical protein [Methanotorris formicicus]|uniref:DUF5673 domain-containing protein n=1 Tax=Methanotorris formicicus Mc-S-70 TaxID=647171 RepID=H1KX47_9EURY|nr:hypothetical protein [Methanotorris formicicus]EHP88572.1 hypothetical protein MetfoDRAFT_0370 [Methanotorris formicicus Mc-S-70]
MNQYVLIIIFYIGLIQLTLTGILYYGLYLAIKSDKNRREEVLYSYRDYDFNIFGKKYCLMFIGLLSVFIIPIFGFLYLYWDRLPEGFGFSFMFAFIVAMGLFIVLFFIKHRIDIYNNGIYIGWRFITWKGFEGYTIKNNKIILIGKRGVIIPIHLNYNKKIEDIVKNYLKRI